jgi:precorrin-3B synthase
MIAINRRGWCPGALAPMLSGDGYIFRLRLTNGALSFECAKIFADLARRFGNGAFDLSARANLQMRGVRGENIAPLQEELSSLGLLDANARAEAARNIVPSPLAGFDASAPLDARPLVVALETLLSRETALHELPPKFGFSIDGGGVLPLKGLVTDIDFTAVSPDRLEVALGGITAGFVAPKNLVAAAEGLARNFLRLRGEDRRMSALVARIGVAPLLADLSTVIASEAKQSTSRASPSVDCFVASAARNDGGEAVDYFNILGAHENFVGIGLLFGRIEADEIETLAHEAMAFGATEFRLTSRRALLAVGVAQEGVNKLAEKLEVLGFILDGGDPRLAFSACPGAPACSHALADVRGVALELAPHWRPHYGRIHVSGCVKGCALHGRALTLVAEREGFSLVENGFARDEPQARGLDIGAIMIKLDTLSRGASV